MTPEHGSIDPGRLHLRWDRVAQSWVGRDPRTMKADSLHQLGIERQSKAAAIRSKCIDCAGGSAAEAARCGDKACSLWLFRMGTDPWRPEPSERQREVGREAAARRRAIVSATPG